MSELGEVTSGTEQGVVEIDLDGLTATAIHAHVMEAIAAGNNQEAWGMADYALDWAIWIRSGGVQDSNRAKDHGSNRALIAGELAAESLLIAAYSDTLKTIGQNPADLAIAEQWRNRSDHPG